MKQHQDRSGRNDFSSRRRVNLNRFLTMWVALLMLIQLPPVFHPPSPDSTNVYFEQRLGAQVPLDLTFTDETGQRVRLGDYLQGKPLILSLNYYHCPNLCSLLLQSLAGSLNNVPFDLGDQYRVLTVSIDPRETSVIAAATREQTLIDYTRSTNWDGWHFLTGDDNAIDQLTAAVGFHYAYDATSDEYAHPSGIIILTPEGKVGRYLYGIDYAPNDLRLALVESSQNKIGTLVDQVLLACYHYDPALGRYTALAMDLTRLGSILVVLGLGSLLFVLWRRDLRQHRALPVEQNHESDSTLSK